MSTSEIFHDYVYVVIATIISVTIFLLTKYVFTRVGGKLGTIALIGVAISVAFSEKNFLSVQKPDGNLLPLIIIIFAVLGTVITYILNVRLDKNPVMSSASINAGLLLPYIYPGFGELLDNCYLCFLCRHVQKRVHSKRILHDNYRVICAITFVYTFSYLGGAGGKLGTIAFGSVIVVLLFRRFWNKKIKWKVKR